MVRPRDLSRLLGNFQTTLQEITIIATEPNALPPDAESEIGGKAVEFRSYMDPTKGRLGYYLVHHLFELYLSGFRFSFTDNDSSLHTQLWIDPTEEFVQYTHSGDPVDITFGMKELKVY